MSKNLFSRGLVVMVLSLVGSFAQAESASCVSLNAKMAATKSFIHSQYGEGSLIFGSFAQSESSLGFRFYPLNQEVDCLGTVIVDSNCRVSFTSTDAIRNGFERLEGLTCWERAQGPQDD